MNLLPNETVLRESSGKTLVLTTHRVRHTTQGTGNVSVRSIMLEELASCALFKTSQPIFLIIAGICSVLGLLITLSGRSAEPLIGALILGGIFVIIYFASQQQTIAFASAGTTIRINAGGMKLEAAKEFIEIAEQAKNARFLLLTR